MGLFSERQCLGVDIGQSSVKMVEAELRRGRIHVRRFGMVALPTETIVQGQIINTDAVVNALKELRGRLKPRQTRVALALPDHQTVMKWAEFPLMTDGEFEDSLEWEMTEKNLLPYDLTETNFAYQVMRRDQTTAKMEVLLMQIKKETAHDYTHVLQLAGFKPAIAEPGAVSLFNMFEAVHGFAGDEAMAIVHVGASQTTLDVVYDGVPRFSRTMQLGGDQVTDAIQRQLGKPFQEAEAAKIGTEGIEPHEITRIVVHEVERILEEVRRSLVFYGINHPREVTRFYVTGGSSRLSAFRSAFQLSFGAPAEVEFLEPFHGATFDPKADRTFAMENGAVAPVALGLALRRPNDIS